MLKIILLCLCSCLLFSKSTTDSLIEEYKKSETKNHKYKILIEIIGKKLLHLDEDSNYYINKAYQIAKQVNDKERIADLDVIYAKYLKIFGNYSKSYEYLHKAKSYYEKTNNKRKIAVTYLGFGETYRVSGDLRQSLNVLAKAERVFSELKDTLELAKVYNQVASVNYEYSNTEGMEKAKKFAELSLELIKNKKNTIELIVSNLNVLGAAIAGLGDFEKAERYLRESYSNLTPELENTYKPLILIHISQTYLERKNYKSALRYGLESYYFTKKTGLKLYLFWIESILSDLYADIGDYKNAYFFRNESNNHYGSIYSEKQRHNMMKIKYDYEKRIKENEIQKNNTIHTYQLLACLVSIIFLIVLVWVFYSKQQVLKKKNNQISEANEKLNEMNVTKDKFFSIIAHDLKGPLYTFSSSMNMLNEDYDNLSDNDRKEFISSIFESSKTLNRLLENLLTWSMSQRGTISYEPSVYNLSKLTETAIAFVNQRSEQKNIKIIKDINPDISVFVDENMILTTIRNLLSNAIKFSYPETNVRIKAMVEENSNINEKPEFVVISVEDNGTGMDNDKLNKIFSLKSTESSKGTAGEAGTGLGLVLCKEFIEKHGGTIRAESKINSGTSFIFKLPLGSS